MLKRFESYIIEKGLFNNYDRLLVAASGGVDSITLCDLLYKSGYHFAIAHCNFQLRDQDSEADMQLVKEVAAKYNVHFYCKHFDIKLYTTVHKVSIQVAARNLRYEWFNETLEKEKFTYLLTAHHASDVTETMLFNLTRGTGIAGLHGILNKLNNIRRPLIFANKEEILAYAVDNKLLWREDVSNSTDKYTRNFLRNKVVPLLKTINPQLESTISETAERMKDLEVFVLHQMKSLKEEAFFQIGENFYIKIQSLENIPGRLSVLFEFIKIFNFSWKDAVSIVKAFDATSGKRFFSQTHVLVKDRTQLIISKINETIFDETLTIDNVARVYVHPLFDLAVTLYPYDAKQELSFLNTLIFDADTLEFPLIIRRWEKGDFFQPLGMKGRKKISDYLIDKKVPLNLKDRVFVIVSKDSLIGILGMSIGEKYKVHQGTKKIIQLSLESVG